MDRREALGDLVAKAVGFGEFVVSFKDEPLSAVLAVFLDLALLQHAEGLAREVLPEDIFGIEDIAQFIAREAIQVRVVGVELGAQGGTTIFTL